ncbi:MAG TPA: choice-of-anchor Q domain-containing protein [Tepidisphaeraceae bacterium]|nr:choice-of-anchor Q domain-containing protein [Tepidisphaeraceae bacterium]
MSPYVFPPSSPTSPAKISAPAPNTTSSAQAAASPTAYTEIRWASPTPNSPPCKTTAAHGGPTLTLLPLTGSPAINAGSNALIPAGITTDQRGDARIVGNVVDIGAVET